MAWNPSPEVALARDLAPKLNADEVVIVHLNFAQDQIGLVTYGTTRQMCAHAKVIGDAAYSAVYKSLERGDVSLVQHAIAMQQRIEQLEAELTAVYSAHKNETQCTRCSRRFFHSLTKENPCPNSPTPTEC